jgi:hypothetical protein
MKKQFNLEAALNGAPFECEDGSQVLKWMYCEEVLVYPIVCFVKSIDGELKTLSFTQDGFHLTSKMTNPLNLVMSPKKVTRWFNVHSGVNSSFYLGSKIGYESKDAAELHSEKLDWYIKTIPIEIELP